MTNEQLRLQMLSGIITESEYKLRLNEQTDTDYVRSEMERQFGLVTNNPEITDQEKKRRINNIRFVVYDFLDPNTNGGTRPSSDFQFDDNWWNSIPSDIDKWIVDDAATDLVRAAKGDSFGENDKQLNEKDSLNEHYVAGGIVGLGAINTIAPREKTDYEMAFEHFLGERYETKFENREQDLEEAEYRPNLVPNPEVSKEEYLQDIAYWTEKTQDLERFKNQLIGRLKRAKNPIVVDDLEGEIDFVQQQIDTNYSMIENLRTVMRKIKEGKEVGWA